MEDEPEKVSERMQEEMEAFAAYNYTKLAILTHFEKAQALLGDMIYDIEKFSNSRKNPRPHNMGRFIGEVLQCWIWIKPKLNYVKGADYKDLYLLDSYLTGDCQIRNLSMKEAVHCFDLIRDYLERTGLTRYEQAKLEGAEELEKDEVEV